MPLVGLAMRGTKRTGNWRPLTPSREFEGTGMPGGGSGGGDLLRPHQRPHHRHVDVAQREVVHGKVWCDLHGHGGYYDCIVPELGVVQDVSQADQGHVLGKEGEG